MKKTLLLSALLVIFVSGCVSEQGGPVKISEIANGGDDGGVSILTAFLPSRSGFIISQMEEITVGTMQSGGGDNLLGRALYRFYIPNWTNTDLTLHLKCTHIFGAPGPLDIYVVDDFGDLSTVADNPIDVSDYWDLVNSGTKVSTLSPSEGWFEVNISNSTVASHLSNGYLAIMVKLSNEDVQTNNFYMLSAYEYAQSRGDQKPYLT